MLPRAKRFLLAVVLVASALAAGAGGAASQGPPCADYRDQPGTGPACRRENGLLEVFDHQGRSLGFTHGPDPETSPAATSTGTLYAKPVACVGGAAGTYYVQVVYARASNDADGYSLQAPAVRAAVQKANGIIGDGATDTGGSASLKVKCVSGVIEVKNVVLPTSKSADSFGTLVRDLAAKGYGDPKVKYWVFYDDCVGTNCGGQGSVNQDDRLTSLNLNNGNAAGATYAFSYGGMDPVIFMHELAHNMGAVQKTAPHSTDPGGSHGNGWHCWDGRDTMCYADGAPRGSWYSTSYCSVEVFDCGKNDYFHSYPPAGNYLATHWNLGSPLNRYISTAMDSTPPDLTVTDPSPGATYNGCTRVGGGTFGPATYAGSVCVKGTASDAQTGIRYVRAYEGGVLKASKVDSGAFTLSWPTSGAKTGVALDVVVMNGDGGTHTYSTTINTT